MACPSLIYSDYPYGILWPVLLWFTLIIPLVSYGLSFFDLLRLSLWYLMACLFLIYSDYPFGILWPVLFLFTLIIPLDILACPLIYSDYPCGILWPVFL
jgi:hypothetical protein